MATDDRLVDSPLAVDSLEVDGPVDSVLPREEQRPSGCVPLPHQVAGHKYGISKVGILQHPDGTVLKQLQPPPRGPREMQFYKQVYAQDCTDPQLLALQQHLPKYYGTWASSESPNEVYLKLEDVTQRFARPCIMDVKIGRKSYDPFASREKREEQIRKYPPMEEVGFLLLGMRVQCKKNHGVFTDFRRFGFIEQHRLQITLDCWRLCCGCEVRSTQCVTKEFHQCDLLDQEISVQLQPTDNILFIANQTGP
ncbi:hypothetical protein NFI96_028449 [Prochilodus magdalenae]|nr:hypothetical protein NFI96_028449 [Prochilodus magdalenae]